MSELELFDNLPIYSLNQRRAELGLPPIEKPPFQNDLPVNLNRIMNFFGHEPADLVRGCPSANHSTLSGWLNGNVSAQMLGTLVKEAADFYSITINYLAFRVPMTDRDFELEKAISEKEEKEKASA